MEDKLQLDASSVVYTDSFNQEEKTYLVDDRGELQSATTFSNVVKETEIMLEENDETSNKLNESSNTLTTNVSSTGKYLIKSNAASQALEEVDSESDELYNVSEASSEPSEENKFCSAEDLNISESNVELSQEVQFKTIGDVKDPVKFSHELSADFSINAGASGINLKQSQEFQITSAEDSSDKELLVTSFGDITFQDTNWNPSKKSKHNVMETNMEQYASSTAENDEIWQVRNPQTQLYDQKFLLDRDVDTNNIKFGSTKDTNVLETTVELSQEIQAKPVGEIKELVTPSQELSTELTINIDAPEKKAYQSQEFQIEYTEDSIAQKAKSPVSITVQGVNWNTSTNSDNAITTNLMQSSTKENTEMWQAEYYSQKQDSDQQFVVDAEGVHDVRADLISHSTSVNVTDSYACSSESEITEHVSVPAEQTKDIYFAPSAIELNRELEIEEHDQFAVEIPTQSFDVNLGAVKNNRLPSTVHLTKTSYDPDDNFDIELMKPREQTGHIQMPIMKIKRDSIMEFSDQQSLEQVENYDIKFAAWKDQISAADCTNSISNVDRNSNPRDCKNTIKDVESSISSDQKDADINSSGIDHNTDGNADSIIINNIIQMTDDLDDDEEYSSNNKRNEINVENDESDLESMKVVDNLAEDKEYKLDNNRNTSDNVKHLETLKMTDNFDSDKEHASERNKGNGYLNNNENNLESLNSFGNHDRKDQHYRSDNTKASDNGINVNNSTATKIEKNTGADGQVNGEASKISSYKDNALKEFESPFMTEKSETQHRAYKNKDSSTNDNQVTFNVSSNHGDVSSSYNYEITEGVRKGSKVVSSKTYSEVCTTGEKKTMRMDATEHDANIYVLASADTQKDVQENLLEWTVITFEKPRGTKSSNEAVDWLTINLSNNEVQTFLELLKDQSEISNAEKRRTWRGPRCAIL